MKIAYDYQTFCLQTYGGISRYHVRLAEQLQKKGETIGVFAPLYRNKHLDCLDADLIHGNKVGNFPSTVLPLFCLLNQVIGRQKIHTWQPDIVHETYYSGNPSSNKSYPIVLTVHDMIHEIRPTMFSRRDSTRRNKKIAVDRADHVICISQSTKNDLVKYLNVSERKMSVVHHGYENTVELKTPTSNSELFDKPYLLFVGNRKGYKNFTNLLDGVASSSELKSKFDVIAFGGERFSKSETAYFDKLGFRRSQIRQISGTDRILTTLYTNATAFVYPSLYEGFGLPPLEAMAHRCPVICSNTSSMPEILGEAAEYFNPESALDIKSAIERVVFSPERINHRVELGTLQLKKYSWERCATETLAIYKQVQREQ